MFSTYMSSIATRQTVTVEEYLRLKHRLHNLRRDYAKLRQSLRSSGATKTRKQRAATLEWRISELELRLSRTDVVVPDASPLSLRERAQLMGAYGAACCRAVAGFAGRVWNFARAKAAHSPRS